MRETNRDGEFGDHNEIALPHSAAFATFVGRMV
jgi:hypothetical protein